MTDPLDFNEVADFHTDLTVGEILRRTRVHYGQTLEQIGQILRIRASQLEALETGDISQLPGRVYAIGFVRSYAEYLGLDGDKMVHLFKNQSVGKSAKVDLQFPVAADDAKAPTFPIVGVGLVVCAIVVILAIVFLSGGKDDDSIPLVPDTMQEEVLNEAPSIIPAPELPQPPPMVNEEDGDTVTGSATGVQRVMINVTENSWVEVRNAADKILLSQVLKKGDQFMVPNEPGMTLSTGNAGALTVILDGKELPKLGKIAEVKRKISLNPSDLLKR